MVVGVAHGLRVEVRDGALSPDRVDGGLLGEGPGAGAIELERGDVGGREDGVAAFKRDPCGDILEVDEVGEGVLGVELAALSSGIEIAPQEDLSGAVVLPPEGSQRAVGSLLSSVGLPGGAIDEVTDCGGGASGAGDDRVERVFGLACRGGFGLGGGLRDGGRGGARREEEPREREGARERTHERCGQVQAVLEAAAGHDVGFR
jgi:hypothetical protein